MNIDFSKINILVIGDLMLDEYIVGRDYKLSDEAPVPVLKVDEFEVYLGGAANVANNVQSLGGSAILCGVIGGAATGDSGSIKHGYSAQRFMRLIDNVGLSSDMIVSGNCRTTTKSRVLINGHQVARYDYEQTCFDSEIYNIIHDNIRNTNFEEVDLIIVSDYKKGVITDIVMDLLKESRCPIIVDPKQGNEYLYNGIFCMTPNLLEFSDMSNATVKNDRSNLNEESLKFIDKYNIDCLSITLGSDGTFYTDGKKSLFVNGHQKEVVNIIGAGDTFVAAIGVSFASGHNMIDAVKFANSAASVVVSKKHTSVCSMQELMDVSL